MICVKGWVVWGDVCEGLLFVELVTGAGVSVVGRLCGLTGAGGGMFAPAGKAGFLIVTGAMGVAVFGDSMGFCTGVGAGAGTAGLMGFAAAAYLARWQESNNFWDYLLDPLFGAISLLAAVRLLLRRS